MLIGNYTICFTAARWSSFVRRGVLAVILLLILMLVYKLVLQSPLQALRRLQQQEIYLLNELQVKHQQAANVAIYQQQLIDVQTHFKKLLPLLMTQSTMANISADISQAGMEAGVYVQVLQPSLEKRQDFYSIVSIDIAVQGGFHQLAEFVSLLSNLAQLVTVENFAITPLAGHNPGSLQAQGQDQLLLTMQLNSYGYLVAETAKK